VNKSPYLVYRCKNADAHTQGGQHSDGNIVAFLGKNQIVVRCNDRNCRAWVVLTLDFPGISIDLRKAGVTQSTLPSTQIFNALRAPVVIEENEPCLK
jgi:hypothetical protein